MTDALPPICFRYDGDGMALLNAHWKRRADKTYVIGAVYTLVPHEERSRSSHNHQFAEIDDVWQNLPEELSALYPTPEALRKFALIKAGYCNVTTFAVESQAEARRTAAVIQAVDPFCVVQVRRDAVLRLTARSQSVKAMGKADFQKSKQAVLEIISDLIGSNPADLSSSGRRDAA